jgi:hypothetical protein
MKAYLKTFPTTTNVIGFQSNLKFSKIFYFLILVTEVDLRPERVSAVYQSNNVIKLELPSRV